MSAEAAAGPERLPATIRRNTLLLACTQAFVGMGSQLIPTLGALMVVKLLESATLAGLAVSLQNVSRFVVAYPIGWVADAYGRRVAMMIGLVLSLIGTVITATALLMMTFPLFVVGLLVFGLGVGAGQQLRLAAADLFPPARRAEGLGYVLTGSVIGALGGPVLISVAQGLANRLSLDPIAAAWLLVPTVLVPSMGLVLLIRPDPREIAANLQHYYPSIRFEPTRLPTVAPLGNLRAWIGYYPLRVAFVSSFAAQGVMTLMMAMTPLVLVHHGHGLPMISVAVALHVTGMYGLSLPIGRLTDRIGRRNVLLLGSLVSVLGAVLIVVTAEYALVTLGVFLVGVGWSFANVSASALIADLTAPGERGRAIGTNDAFSMAGSILLALIGGPLVEYGGMAILAYVSAGLMVVPVVMLLRLRDASPAQHRRLAGGYGR
ncbi:MAG: MFS transporter [Chloroflexi bacterium]|nr:MFS transporter [Chloroflexota bacterium]